MSRGEFANEDVMEEYLSSMLTEEAAVADSIQRQSVERLLKTVSNEKIETKQKLVPEKKQEIVAKVIPQEVEKLEKQAKVKSEDIELLPETQEQQPYREGSFQALYFDVAGLTLAVPLTELGGIHNLGDVNPLFGKPSWFKGVMLYREEKLNVVDSVKWVMPEKYDEKLAESLNYQYLIMLDNSGWGLTCESLVNTVTLQQEDVKWRESRGKRPWLAGMVKEKMCALIDVKQLVKLLNQGLGSNDDK